MQRCVFVFVFANTPTCLRSGEKEVNIGRWTATLVDLMSSGEWTAIKVIGYFACLKNLYFFFLQVFDD